MQLENLWHSALDTAAPGELRAMLGVRQILADQTAPTAPQLVTATDLAAQQQRLQQATAAGGKLSKREKKRRQRAAKEAQQAAATQGDAAAASADATAHEPTSALGDQLGGRNMFELTEGDSVGAGALSEDDDDLALDSIGPSWTRANGAAAAMEQAQQTGAAADAVGSGGAAALAQDAELSLVPNPEGDELLARGSAEVRQAPGLARSLDRRSGDSRLAGVQPCCARSHQHIVRSWEAVACLAAGERLHVIRRACCFWHRASRTGKCRTESDCCRLRAAQVASYMTVHAGHAPLPLLLWRRLPYSLRSAAPTRWQPPGVHASAPHAAAIDLRHPWPPAPGFAASFFNGAGKAPDPLRELEPWKLERALGVCISAATVSLWRLPMQCKYHMTARFCISSALCKVAVAVCACCTTSICKVCSGLVSHALGCPASAIAPPELRLNLCLHRTPVLQIPIKRWPLYKQALTGPTALASSRRRAPQLDSYERSEFLGDAVVEDTVGQLLSAQFGAADAAALRRMQMQLVANVYLYRIAMLLELDKFVAVGVPVRSWVALLLPAIH